MVYAIKQLFEALLKTNRKVLFWVIFSTAIIIRIILAITTNGYQNDLALFHYWANHVFDAGIVEFYQLDIFVDYPPGYMYVLYLLGALFQIVPAEVNSIAYLLILKLPIICFDMLVGYLVLKVARHKLNDRQAYGLVILFLFNPWTLVNGVVWGQVDIIFSCILIMSLLSFTQQRTVKGSIYYALAALIKPQAFIFMPVLLVYLAYRKQIKPLLICVITGFTTFLLLAMPFFYQGDGISQLISLYAQTLASYPYASLNTYNIYSLLGFNWVNISERIFTVPIELISYIAIALIVIIVFLYSIKMKRSASTYFYLAAITIASVYLFVAKMHERYLFPILLCLLFAYIYEKSKHYLYILIGFSITTTINLLAVLQIQQTLFTVPYDVFLVSCSVINIGLYAYLLWVGCKNFKTEQFSSIGDKKSIIKDETNCMSTTSEKKKIELLKVGAVLLVYSIVAFYNLGSHQAPQTAWQPVQQSEYIIFDLGEVKQIDQAVIFSGASHKGSYTISSYQDDVWQQQLSIQNKHTYALAYQVWDMNVRSQYIMLHADEPNFSIHELAFFNKDSEIEPLQLSINQSNSENTSASSPTYLIDEQAMMKNKPTHLDESYFDEIYHARTAFEYLNGTQIYETTHPPLGKLLIALGLQLFGFSPFGWRVMGTIVGVAVLLILYYFAKLLFDKSSYALAAMLLFAVDFMHFTQSRIATIDIYSICFTLLMFLFMTWYSKLNFFRVKLWKTWIPLGLSGICFGLGIATKWNGFYGGAGLAVMLLLVFIQRYREYEKENKQKKYRGTSKEAEKGKSFSIKTPVKLNYFWHAIGSTIGYCCLFFIVIPAIIYYSVFQVSFLLSGKQLGWSKFIGAQQSMFSYHSDLVATHPFSSPWYEWQIMLKPIWYYINNNLHDTALTSTIAAFGNPLIWWLSILTMFATLIWSIYKKHTIISVVYIGYFSQLLPWLFVNRITFIYHFFGMVPFLILSIIYIFQQLERRYEWAIYLRWHFIIIATLLFIMFYPVLSGEPIARYYVDHALRWFKSWYF